MSDYKVLLDIIAESTEVSRLETLKATGLDKMIADPFYTTITADNKDELIAAINARIAELQA